MSMLRIVCICCQQNLYPESFEKLEHMLKVRLVLELWINSILFLMTIAEALCKSQLSQLIERIQKHHRGHHIESLAIKKVSLSVTFDEIAHPSNSEGQVNDPRKYLCRFNRVVFDGLREKELEISNQRVYHGLFIANYLCLRK